MFPSTAPPSCSGAARMVASQIPLPADPPSTDGDLLGLLAHPVPGGTGRYPSPPYAGYPRGFVIYLVRVANRRFLPFLGSSTGLDDQGRGLSINATK